MSKNFNLVKGYYDRGLWAINQVKNTVNRPSGITVDEYFTITSCIYPSIVPEPMVSETTLWTGTTTAAGDITLSNSILGFKQIKVYMMSNAGSYFTTKTIDVKDIVVNTTATNCHNIGFYATASYFADFVFYFYANTT